MLGSVTANGTARLPTRARRSVSVRDKQMPTAAAETPTPTRATTIAPSLITPRRSASIHQLEPETNKEGYDSLPKGAGPGLCGTVGALFFLAPDGNVVPLRPNQALLTYTTLPARSAPSPGGSLRAPVAASLPPGFFCSACALVDPVSDGEPPVFKPLVYWCS